MSSANAKSSISSGGPGEGDSINDDTRIEVDLIQRGNLVGEASLEWSLNFLTRNCDFLNERSMSPLSIYAVHVWTGSQNCEFANKLSFQGKIRNMLFKLLIHPVHELVNNLKTNAYYIAALSSKKPFDFEQNMSSHGLEIPLISGKYFDGDFILNQMKWIYKLFHNKGDDAGKLSLEFEEDDESFDITFSDDLIEFSKVFSSKLIFHWLTHHILTNFLYNPNGPISLLSFNILIEKLSPFFSKYTECSQIMYSDIIAFSDSVWGIWRNMREKNINNLLSVANCLEKYTSESEAFMKCLTNVVLKHSLDELLDNLSEFVIAINDELPCTNLHSPLPISARPNTSFLVDGEEKAIPPDVDPKEPFNSIFEATGFERAVSACREFPDLLRPKASYSEKVVKTTQLVLNYCLRNNLADFKYIRKAGYGKEVGGSSPSDVLDSKSRTSSYQELDTKSLAEQNAVLDEKEAIKQYLAGGTSKSSLNGSSNERSRVGAEKSILKRKNLFKDDDLLESEKLKRINLYSNDKGKTGRKISVRGISESSDSSEDTTPKPIVFEKRRSDEQQSVSKRASIKRTSASPNTGTSRQYRRWSDEETSLLIDGVNKFGLGKWRIILATSKFTNRDEVGLKDRWRNLVKGGHVTWDSQTRIYRSVKE
ncbi:telomeric DNA binding SANT DNA-binding domain [Cryptosporidium sp. chipmunk genotype I]|uniref:telomeric DNA binding SANT DNA-binding domain n=1 Tax=Cryptosporidium sp. chipmunk genotype I TaxID=1280935 RepID=UPI00351A5C05|nr:telomeric DNA binding SANT DNA-binding domain [Cryptosporidium sp. chipmunk genotype I]